MAEGLAKATDAGQCDVGELSSLPKQPRRHFSRLIIGVIVVGVVVFLLQSAFRNPAAQWNYVGQYLFNNAILKGVLTTIEISALSMVIALALAVCLAIARLSRNPVLQWFGYTYVWLFRSLPLLVLLLVTFNISLFYPHFAFGIPFGPTFFSIHSQNVISALLAAVIAFALHEAAYSSEIIRASIVSIPQGQRDAARAVGMHELQIYHRIILPQALRVAVPPLANDTINMVKNTSLVAFIAVPDLMYTAQSIYENNYRIVPLLIVASLWYLAVISALTLLQTALERRLGRSTGSGSRLRRSVMTEEVT